MIEAQERQMSGAQGRTDDWRTERTVIIKLPFVKAAQMGLI